VILAPDRIVHILDCDIATEEDRARVSDHSDAAYPMLARTLAARRKNLKVADHKVDRSRHAFHQQWGRQREQSTH
jgi:hypothetical protein